MYIGENKLNDTVPIDINICEIVCESIINIGIRDVRTRFSISHEKTNLSFNLETERRGRNFMDSSFLTFRPKIEYVAMKVAHESFDRRSENRGNSSMSEGK